MKKGGALPTRAAVLVMLQVADGVAAAHDKRVLHRDLKPENVMFTGEPSGGSEVKVIDFGLAKEASADDRLFDSLTPAGWFIGSVQYTSPENCRGLRLDARADVYSLGIILYEMLAGRRPFLETTIVNLCRQHMNGTPPFIGDLRRDIPPRLAALIMQSLNKARCAASECAGVRRPAAGCRASNPARPVRRRSGSRLEGTTARPVKTGSPQLEYLTTPLGGRPDRRPFAQAAQSLQVAGQTPRCLKSSPQTLGRRDNCVLFRVILGALLIFVLLFYYSG